MELEVSEDGINVTFKDLSSWDMSEDSLEGNTIENKPDTDNDNSWDNAGNGTIGGSTIENQPSTLMMAARGIPARNHGEVLLKRNQMKFKWNNNNN